MPSLSSTCSGHCTSRRRFGVSAAFIALRRARFGLGWAVAVVLLAAGLLGELSDPRTRSRTDRSRRDRCLAADPPSGGGSSFGFGRRSHAGACRRRSPLSPGRGYLLHRPGQPEGAISPNDPEPPSRNHFRRGPRRCRIRCVRSSSVSCSSSRPCCRAGTRRCRCRVGPRLHRSRLCERREARCHRRFPTIGEP